MVSEQQTGYMSTFSSPKILTDRQVPVMTANMKWTVLM